MAGEFLWKERSIITLSSSQSSLANLTGVAAGIDLDVRTSGNAVGDDTAIFELACAWGTTTGIVAGVVVAELYLVPKMDGTNLPQIDLTSGSSYIPYAHRVGTFVAAATPSTSTTTRFTTASVDAISILPLLYTAHIINRSGQTISSSWSLKVITARHQYT